MLVCVVVFLTLLLLAPPSPETNQISKLLLSSFLCVQVFVCLTELETVDPVVEKNIRDLDQLL